MHLNRAQAYKDILTRVIKEEEKYGTTNSAGKQFCIVCYSCTSNDANMDHLRSLLLGEHISRLLRANGYVKYVKYHSTFRKKWHNDGIEKYYYRLEMWCFVVFAVVGLLIAVCLVG